LRSTGQERLKPEDYRSKPEIAARNDVRDLKSNVSWFQLKQLMVVWGERLRFVNVLYELKLDFAVTFAAIMQSGCRANKRCGIIDGENLSASSVMVRLNFASHPREIIFGNRAQPNSGS